MSKIKIAGNASGSGTLTIASPDTSSSRTITLPDETATLSTFDPDGAVTINDTGNDVDFRVESDNDANALLVRGSDGNIGIGTGTPTFPIMIHTSANSISGSNVDVSELTIKISNPENDTDEAVGIGFGVSTSANAVGAAIIHERKGANSTGDLHFATAPSGEAAGADIPIRMTIKADGRGLSQFTAKAWLNYKGTTTNSVRDSHNISSVADNSTGNYTPNFTNNIGANYTVSTSCSYNNQKAGTKSALMAVDNVGIVTSAMGATTLADADTVMMTIFGDN